MSASAICGQAFVRQSEQPDSKHDDDISKILLDRLFIVRWSTKNLFAMF